MKNIKTAYLLIGLIILLIGVILTPIIKNRLANCDDCLIDEPNELPKEETKKILYQMKKLLLLSMFITKKDLN